MADNVDVTPGTGVTVAADDIGGVFFQRVKLAVGADGAGTDLNGTAARGAYVDPRLSVVRLSQTPTVSTSPAYAAKDAIGGLLTFANAARSSGGSCWVEAVQIEDKGQQMAPLDLVLFDRTLTTPTDNAIFAPTDAELATCVGAISFVTSDYRDFSTNAVGVRQGIGLPITLNGTDLFGVLVNRGAPTYTSTSDIVVTLSVVQD